MAKQPVPSYLGGKRRSAKSASTNEAETGRLAPVRIADTIDAPTGGESDIPRANSVKSKKERKPATGAERGKVRADQSLSDPTRDQTLSGLRALASRPEMFDLAEIVRPGATHGAFSALLDGAMTRGPSGAADRGQLWRILGMPWVAEGAGAKAAGAMLGAAVGEAVARLEGGRRHRPVTLDHAPAAKVLEVLEEKPLAHMLAQHEDGDQAPRGGAVEGQEGVGQGEDGEAGSPTRRR